ncbi:hypothetical protein [Mesorhizobium sp. Z1-4]|uniref:hypothetical protein n=1 Tax=Mesorhizobium sp. Z1-4 TaxID=2448478 RepID=UPI000FDA6BAC|nr:hypothetical protein [Mesorhizobium sp. Z1-4]
MFPRILATILLIAYSCGFAHSQSKKRTESFPLCESRHLGGGELLYLARNGRELCWRHLGKRELNGSDAAIRGTSYRFAYIFGDENLPETFDPIFNVKIMAVRKDGDTRESIVELYRDRIETLCRRVGPIEQRGRFDNREYDRKAVNGHSVNNYHKNVSGTPGPDLSGFHIWFLNARDRCEKTDSPELKKLFALYDTSIGNPDPGLFVRLKRALGVGSAIAEASSYRRISIEIGRGSFRGNVHSASFAVPAHGEHKIEVNDLSTYLPGDFGRRRPRIAFTLVE